MIGLGSHRPLVKNWERDEFFMLRNVTSKNLVEATEQTKSDVLRVRMKPDDCMRLDLSELLPPSIRHTDAEILQDDQKTLAWFCETVGYVTKNLKKKARGAANAVRVSMGRTKQLMDRVLRENDIEIIDQSFDGLERQLNSIVRDFLKVIEGAKTVNEDAVYAVRNYVILRHVGDWQDQFVDDLKELSQ